MGAIINTAFKTRACLEAGGPVIGNFQPSLEHPMREFAKYLMETCPGLKINIGPSHTANPNLRWACKWEPKK